MQLHFESAGSGTPVVLLHGLFGSSDNWRTVARALGERYRVILVDQRNHGRSPHHARMDYPSMALDVSAVLEGQGAGPAHVLGHSMGGKTAMQLALDFPGLVRSLVVVDIAPVRYDRLHDRILEALSALRLTRYGSRHAMEEALAPRIPDIDVRRFLLKSAVRKGDGGFQWQFGLREIAENYEALGAALSLNHPYPGPALFIRGGDSDYIQTEGEAAIKKGFPSATITEIPGASHWVHAEKSREFLAAVQAFFDAH